MARPDTRFNPAYSTIKSITLVNALNEDDVEDLRSLVITNQNPQCVFERLELVENVNEILPQGTILVADRSDITSYIYLLGLKYVIIEFFSGKKWYGDITSVAYSNNAASDSEDSLVVINFTNSYYKEFSSTSLNALWGARLPSVYQMNEFVSLMKSFIFKVPAASQGYQDFATNYFLYKPLNPYNNREEAVSDSVFEMMNYVATGAIDQYGNPTFLFWTGFDNSVNFKAFYRDITKDQSFTTIDNDYRNIAVFDGDSVLQELSDRKIYRKAYFLSTNPSFQWISKNYYYIRKTPKYLDTLPPIFIDPTLEGDDLNQAIDAAYEQQTQKSIKNLSFHFQDDGQKYNIDVVTTAGRGTTAPQGADNIAPEHSWGYDDGSDPSNNESITTMMGQNYGTNYSYKELNLMGLSGFMPFRDSPDMWKNMFNITPIHPHYPDELELDTLSGISGADTNLQKVMRIRYNVFMGLSGPNSIPISGSTFTRLDELREIEAQNFVMYSLCCMGQKEDCFFAVLQKYEVDSAYYGANAQFTPPTPPNDGKYYRYKWNKINFGSGNSGATCGGCSGGVPTGTGGATYDSHLVEKWCLDPFIKSNDTQDETWAINLNERGLTGSYLPPGWSSTTTSSFKFRPIGANVNSSISTSGDIFHIARVCINQTDANSRVIYFWAENVLDGTC